MENQPKTGAQLPPGFWSQPSSDQLERIEALLQRFLSLPGIQNEGQTPSQDVIASGEETPVGQLPSAPPPKTWAPSGSTWGPLAEAWKSVQGKTAQEGMPVLEREPPASRPANPPPIPTFGTKPNFSAHSVSDQTVVPWNFPQGTSNQSFQEFSAGTIPSGYDHESPDSTADSAPLNGTQGNSSRLGSQPEKPGWFYSSLVLTNRLFDGGIRQLGAPGKILSSSFGKWILGLAGVVLFTTGSWFYLREALEEMWGQFRLGGPAGP